MKQKVLVFPLLCVLLFVIGLTVFGLSLFHQADSFTPPVAELNARSGRPVVPEELGWSELYQEGMPYSLYICGVCEPNEENQIAVWFYNPAENDVLLSMKVYDGDTCIGETGFLKPDEYVQYVSVDQKLDEGADIRYEIIGYEPDTYYSAGTVSLNTSVSYEQEA